MYSNASFGTDIISKKELQKKIPIVFKAIEVLYFQILTRCVTYECSIADDLCVIAVLEVQNGKATRRVPK